MARVHRKRHVKLAVFGCVKCGRFVFAPSSYQFDNDVTVCECHASRYKTTKVRAPEHVQAYWDAQCRAAHSVYRRRLKHYALPSVHAERVLPSVRAERFASDELGWRFLNFDSVYLQEESLDLVTSTPSVHGSESTAKSTDFQRQPVSILHTFRSAIVSGLSRVADLERENKGKAS